MRWIVLVASATLVSCLNDDPRIDVRVRWEGSAPQVARTPYAFFVLATPDGEAVQIEGPTEVAAGGRVEILGVPVGRQFVLAASVHATPWRNERVLGSGTSEVFELRAGERRTIEIGLRSGGSGTGVPAEPPGAETERITLHSAPWGSEASNGAPAFSLIGETGALPARARFVVFDAMQIEDAVELARGESDEQGAFRVELAGLGDRQRERIYIARATDEHALSDSSTIAGLQAALVHRHVRTISFGGKVAGNAYPNPHHLARVAPASGALIGEEGTQREADDARALLRRDGDRIGADSVRAWTEVKPPRVPPARLGAGFAFDRRRGRFVLTGGAALGSALADLWEWDGRMWHERTVLGESPGPRIEPAFAFNAATGESMLFGGTRSALTPSLAGSVAPSQLLDDLWGWDGTRWTLRDGSDGERPEARLGASLVYDSARGVMVLFGGAGTGQRYADTWIFDGRWVRTALEGPAPSPRVYAAAAFDAIRERVVLVGGLGADGQPLADQWEWDGARWERSSSENVPARWGASLAHDRNRARLVLFGGSSGNYDDPLSGFSNEVWEHGEAGWQRVSTVEAAPAQRIQASFAYDPLRRHVLLFGGHRGVAAADTWTWDGQRWRLLFGREDDPASLLLGRSAYHEATGRLVHFGGASLDSRRRDWTFEWSSGWIRRAPPLSPPPLVYHAMAHHRPSQRIILFGGEDGTYYYDHTWAHDGVQWERLNATGPSHRIGAALAPEASGDLLLFGGYAVGVRPLQDTWRFAGGRWTRTGTVGPTPSARGGAEMVLDEERGRVVLFGGGGANGLIGDTWEWDGARWHLVASGGPAPRWLHALTYDRDRKRVLLLNGCILFNECHWTDDVWIWIGEESRWQLEPISGETPGPRVGSAVAYNPAEHAVMLSGGSRPANVSDATWGLSAQGWRPLDGPHAVPGPRVGAGMAYSRARGEIVLSGGCKEALCNAIFQDGWSFNGHAWRRLATTGEPPARGWHVFAESPSGNGGPPRLFAGGGILRDFSFDLDAWELDGTTWQRSRLNFGYLNSGAAYDPVADRLLIFGGIAPDLRLGGAVWIWDGHLTTTAADVPPRHLNAVAFDEARGRLVSVGGCGGRPSSYNACEEPLERHDEWDGERWHAIESADRSITRRAGAAITYDPLRGRVLLFGGFEAASLDDGLFEFDGQAWHKVQVIGPSPPGRELGRLAFHPESGAAVLFGGARQYNVLVPLDDTWRFESSPESRPAWQVKLEVASDVAEAARVTALHVRASAAGRGFETTIPGVGTAHGGAKLEVWDAWSGAWTEVAANTAGGEPAELGWRTPSPEIARRAIDGDGKVNVRVLPVLGIGTGNDPARVELDFFELDVELDRR